MYHKTSYMSPDEHFQDLKRFICACMGHANRISVIMPLLYESRQHRRKGRESLDCAMALQELERLGVKEIITFDAHDPNIQNAIPCSSFDSFYVTTNIIESMMKNDQNMFNNPDNYLVISPDVGAMDRARYYADMLGTDVGICYKRRDLSKIVNGKNPVVAHEYLGKDVSGKSDQQKIDTIRELISQGYYVTVQVSNSNPQHWVAVDNVVGNQVNIFDPSDSRTVYGQRYPISRTRLISYFKVTSQVTPKAA